MLCELFCKTDDEFNSFPHPFSNKNNDMVHFHERKLLDNFKEITMEKGCLQNIMRFMR